MSPEDLSRVLGFATDNLVVALGEAIHKAVKEGVRDGYLEGIENAIKETGTISYMEPVKSFTPDEKRPGGVPEGFTQCRSTIASCPLDAEGRLVENGWKMAEPPSFDKV